MISTLQISALSISSCQVRWGRADELRSDQLERVIQMCPVAVRARILRLRLERDRKASALSKWLVACCLGDGENPRRVFDSMRYTDSGQLRLEDMPSAEVSISHSGDISVCALSLSGLVGVDIEQKRPVAVQDFRDIFHPETWEIINRFGRDTFFDHWTILEAVAKGAGTGLAGPVRSILTHLPAITYGGRTWDVHRLTIDPEYACHLAVASRAAPTAQAPVY